jgi:hypothetical protein
MAALIFSTSTRMSAPNSPLRFDCVVPADGRIELQLPLPADSHVTVYVVEDDRELDDLAAAAMSSTDFWDNPQDDEDWNDA